MIVMLSKLKSQPRKNVLEFIVNEKLVHYFYELASTQIQSISCNVRL